MDEYAEDFDDDASPSYLQPSYGDYSNYGEDINNLITQPATLTTTTSITSQQHQQRGGSGKGKVVFSSGTKASSPPAFNVNERDIDDVQKDDEDDEGVDRKARKLAEANAALDAMTRLMQAPTPFASSNTAAPGEAVDRKMKKTGGLQGKSTGSGGGVGGVIRRQSAVSMTKTINTTGPVSSVSSLVSFSKEGNAKQVLSKPITSGISSGGGKNVVSSSSSSASSSVATSSGITTGAVSPLRSSNATQVSTLSRPLAPPQSPIRSPGGANTSPIAVRAPLPPSSQTQSQSILSTGHHSSSIYIPMPTSSLELEAALREKERQKIELEKQVNDLRNLVAEVRERSDVLLKEKEKQLRAALRKTEQLQIENESLQQQTSSAFQTAKFLEMDNLRRERELTSQKLSEENKKLMAQVRQMSRQMEDAAAAQGALPARLAAAMEEVRVERERSRRAKEELAKDKENSKRLHEQTIALTDSNRELKLKMQSMQQLMQQRAGMSSTTGGGGGGSSRNIDDAKSVAGKSISGRSISGARSVFGGGKSVAGGARSVAGGKQMSLSARTNGGGLGGGGKKKPFGSGPGTKQSTSKISMVSSSNATAPKAGTRAALAKGSLSTRARADLTNAGHSNNDSVIVIHTQHSTTPHKQSSQYGRDEDEGYGDGFSSPAGAVSGSPGGSPGNNHSFTTQTTKTHRIIQSSTSTSISSQGPIVSNSSQLQKQAEHTTHSTNWESEKQALLDRLSLLESKTKSINGLEDGNTSINTSHTENTTQNINSTTELANLLKESKEERERAQEKANQLESTVGLLQRQLREMSVSINQPGQVIHPSNTISTVVSAPTMMTVKSSSPSLINSTSSPYVSYDTVLKTKQLQQSQQQQQQQSQFASTASTGPQLQTTLSTTTEDDQYGEDKDFETVTSETTLPIPTPVQIQVPIIAPVPMQAPSNTPSFSFGPKPSIGSSSSNAYLGSMSTMANVSSTSSVSSAYTFPQSTILNGTSPFIMGPAPLGNSSILGPTPTLGSSPYMGQTPNLGPSPYMASTNNTPLYPTSYLNNNSSLTFSKAIIASSNSESGSVGLQQQTSLPSSYIAASPMSSIQPSRPTIIQSSINAGHSMQQPFSSSSSSQVKVEEEQVTNIVEVEEQEVQESGHGQTFSSTITSISKPSVVLSRNGVKGGGFDPLLDDDDEDVGDNTNEASRGTTSSPAVDRFSAPTPAPYLNGGVPRAYTSAGVTSTITREIKKKNPMDLFSDDE